MKQLVLFAILFSLSSHAVEVEPAYCNPATFSKYEINYPGNKPKRIHAYKIGRVVLAGMAVGGSDATDVANVSLEYSNATPETKYCTWYYNDGNSAAEKMFTWKDLPKPTGSNYTEMADKFEALMGSHFDADAVNYVSCAVEHGYVAVGCNGQMHRGPSVFAMILAYGGCTPQHATEIVNALWGNNGIKTEMRIALATRASEFAAANPFAAELFRSALRD